jgi:hypothetical protein
MQLEKRSVCVAELAERAGRVVSVPDMSSSSDPMKAS